MKIVKRMLTASAVVIFGATLYACGAGNSSAVTGTLTQAEFDSFLATSSAFTSLKAQVAAIGSPAVYIRAPNAPMVQVASRRTESVGGGNAGVTAQALPSPCNWTLTGRPTSSDPIQSDTFSGVSCSGYYFDISGAATSSDNATIQQLGGNAYVAFDAAGCTGNAYVINIPSVAVVNGIVFGMNPQDPNFQGTDPSNAAYYWYVAAATSAVTVSMQSEWQPGIGCSNNSGSPVGYSALTNDPAITGIPSAPVQGPVLIGS